MPSCCEQRKFPVRSFAYLHPIIPLDDLQKLLPLHCALDHILLRSKPPCLLHPSEVEVPAVHDHRDALPRLGGANVPQALNAIAVGHLNVQDDERWCFRAIEELLAARVRGDTVARALQEPREIVRCIRMVVNDGNQRVESSPPADPAERVKWPEDWRKEETLRQAPSGAFRSLPNGTVAGSLPGFAVSRRASSLSPTSSSARARSLQRPVPAIPERRARRHSCLRARHELSSRLLTTSFAPMGVSARDSRGGF